MAPHSPSLVHRLGWALQVPQPWGVPGASQRSAFWQAASVWQQGNERQPSAGQSNGVAVVARQPLNCGVQVH